MGRRLLLNRRGPSAPRSPGRLVTALGAWLVLAACGGGGPQLHQVRAPDDPHRDIACSTCHAGPLVDAATWAAVPPQTCTASGCHTEEGPRRVRLGSVEFLHRGHAGDSVVAMSCAGCHLHESGSEPLRAGVDSCSLCHLSQQSAGLAGECRTCHVQPRHVALASQGAEIPHQGLPWIEGGCIRCHFDVTEPPVEVPLAKCAGCHLDLDRAVARGIGEDLHGTHTGVSCVNCHEEGTHRIRAMSSAVDLRCVDCHAREHDVQLTGDFPAAATCNDCHGEVHQAQQRLMLGLVEGLAAPAPSEKFMDGLTCGSCHQQSGARDPDLALSGSAESCVGCHRAEYRTILQWWRTGGQVRVARTATFVDGGVARLATADDSLGMALAEAQAWVTLVREAGALHNLPLAHQLLQEASDRVAAAYRVRGLGMPAPPALGRQPRMGLCTYCHYRPDDPWLFQEMSGSFHRDVLRIN
jgi:predicted CXXCH cytochrome family protein